MVKTLRLLRWAVALSVLVPMSASAQVVPNKLEPPGPPGPTMKTLDEVTPIWSQVLPAVQRFQLVMGDQAVLDKETGLVWQRQPWDLPIDFRRQWADSSRSCHALRLGGRMGWRLPSLEELYTLIDPSTGEAGQYLPAGHPFIGIRTDFSSPGYWTTTTAAAGQKFVVFSGGLYSGESASTVVGEVWNFARTADQATGHLWWCVRGGHGGDAQ